MKRFFKKNQVIVTTLALMIAAAGYLNYSGAFLKHSDSVTTKAEVAEQELLDLSDEEVESKEVVNQDGEESDGTPGEAVLTNGVAESAVAYAKVAREQNRAQNKEILQGIVDNTTISEEEKKDAIAQMIQMTELSEQEITIETLMASKGFSDAVVSLTADSADIVVNAKDLTDANRAQIEDIVARKTDIAPENIVITPIHE